MKVTLGKICEMRAGFKLQATEGEKSCKEVTENIILVHRMNTSGSNQM